MGNAAAGCSGSKMRRRLWHWQRSERRLRRCAAKTIASLRRSTFAITLQDPCPLGATSGIYSASPAPSRAFAIQITATARKMLPAGGGSMLMKVLAARPHLLASGTVAGEACLRLCGRPGTFAARSSPVPRPPQAGATSPAWACAWRKTLWGRWRCPLTGAALGADRARCAGIRWRRMLPQPWPPAYAAPPAPEPPTPRARPPAAGTGAHRRSARCRTLRSAARASACPSPSCARSACSSAQRQRCGAGLAPHAPHAAAWAQPARAHSHAAMRQPHAPPASRCSSSRCFESTTPHHSAAGQHGAGRA